MALLESIILDNRDEEEIQRQARLRVFNESGGQLNDFTENSPVAALIQGQAFAAAEFLYHVNKLPLSLVVDFLKVTGVERGLGTKAKVTLTFTLSSPQSVPFIIPQGFEVVDTTGNFIFLTDSSLQIPAGLTSGSVTATADEVGSKYNLPAFSVEGFTLPLTFLSGVTNTQPALGGTDEETVEQSIDRALVQLRLRNLVSADDYEQAAEILLGEGSVCTAIGLLGKDKSSRELGAVHLFLLNANGEPANDAQISFVRNELLDRIQLGTALHISPMELLPISTELTAYLTEGQEPSEAIDTLWQAYQEYLSPSKYPPGQDIKLYEVGHILRSTGVVKEVSYVTLNGSTLNIPLPNNYTLPTPYSLFIQLVDDNGVVFSALRGAGEPPDFNEDGGIV